MSYKRVIPRDFFNEAKLLKCFGRLSIKIADRLLPEGVNIEINECGEAFDIHQTNDGRHFISNYEVTVNDNYVSLSTTSNSHNNYPMVCFHDNEETTVFDENGEFAEEFIEFCKNL